MNLTLSNKLITISGTRPAPEATTDDQPVYDDPADNRFVQDTINVSVELLQRLYSGLFIIQQSFKTYRGDYSELASLMTVAIDENLIKPLSRTFLDMKEFEYKLEVDYVGNTTITGTNTFSSTILRAINLSIQSPVSVHDD